MDDFKKFAAGASAALTRAVQYTEEKLGSAEKTEVDAHFQGLVDKSDKTKLWTEKLVKSTETVLQPNPNVRMEDFLYEKFDKKKRDRLNNMQHLGADMISAGNDFGPGTNYGSALIKCGTTCQMIGTAERTMIDKSAAQYLSPLKTFLDGDMKTIAKERRILETKRLDLDAAKNRLRKAKSLKGKEDAKLTREAIEGAIDKAETELRVCQTEFDRQSEVTKLLLEGMNTTHANHMRYLGDFVEAQMNYYSQCQAYMADLQRQMGITSNLSPSMGRKMPSGQSGAMGTSEAATIDVVNHDQPSQPFKRAKVLYDFEAASKDELSLVADEIITVYAIKGETEWWMAKRGSQKGKVPSSYIEIMTL